MPTSAARRQRLVTYLVIVFGLALLLARTEIQDRKLAKVVRAEALQDWTECEERNRNVDKINWINDRIISAERSNPFIDDDLRAERIAIYSAAKLVPGDCGPKPR